METSGSRTWILLLRTCSSQPIFTAGFEQVEGADDVGGDEIRRAADGTIYVRFRCEVENVRDFMFDEDSADGREITQVHFLKDVFRVVIDSGEIREVTRVGEAIEVDEPGYRRLVNDVAD